MTGFLFPALANRLLNDLANGHCVSVTGLSNSGKSMLMRSLATPEGETVYKKKSRRTGVIIYIDGNQAVANSAQAFYEVILRTTIKRLAGSISLDLMSALQGYHQSITEAENSFTASLSFNLALSDLCEQLDRDLCLLFDEFGNIYISLDDRALLNLRSLRDRFHSQLTYATATWRSLPELRGEPIEDEFAEMFSRFTYHMPLLDREGADLFLQRLDFTSMPEGQREACYKLSGGHPGLIVAIAQVLSNLPEGFEVGFEDEVRQEPQPRAECLKIWNQLDDNLRLNIVTLVLEANIGLPPQQMRQLEALSLVVEGKLFSPIFSDFVARKGRGSYVEEQGVYLDSDSGDVWVDGIRIPVLTDLEFRLLELLYNRRDKLTDKYMIVTTVWGEDYLGQVDDARVEKLISRLRSKIEPDPTEPRYLITRRGRGYKLLTNPKSS
jgi:DNA-binding winged helix-turn-helix (wHTH) protein